MSKHTPGPWRVCFNYHCVEIETQIGGMGQGDRIATARSGEQTRIFPENEIRANARLIAAAPHLLETVKLTRVLLKTLLPIFEALDGFNAETEYADGMRKIIVTIETAVEACGEKISHE